MLLIGYLFIPGESCYLRLLAPRYVIKIREFAKFVVGLGEKVSATDIEEGMRVGVDTSHGGKLLSLVLPPCGCFWLMFSWCLAVILWVCLDKFIYIYNIYICCF